MFISSYLISASGVMSSLAVCRFSVCRLLGASVFGIAGVVLFSLVLGHVKCLASALSFIGRNSLFWFALDSVVAPVNVLILKSLCPVWASNLTQTQTLMHCGITSCQTMVLFAMQLLMLSFISPVVKLIYEHVTRGGALIPTSKT